MPDDSSACECSWSYCAALPRTAPHDLPEIVMSVEVRRPMESADDDVISAMLGIMPFRALFNEEPTNSGR